MSELSRTEERIKVIQGLYEVFAFDENKVDYDATDILCKLFEVESFDYIPNYSKYIYTLALENLDSSISLINKHLNKWTFPRLDNVAKAILVLGVTEGNLTTISNKKIVINSMVELAKKFLKAGDYKYINAVLDKAIK